MDTLSEHFDIANLGQILAVFNGNGDSVFVNDSLRDENNNGVKGPDTLWVRLRKSAIETILLHSSHVELDVLGEKALMFPLKIEQETFAILLPSKRRNAKTFKVNNQLFNQLKLIATHATYVASLVKINGGLSYVSPSAQNILGYSAAEMMNQDEDYGLLEPYKTEYLRYLDETRNGMIRKDGYEFEFKKKNGDTVWLHAELSPIFENGVQTHVQSNVHDISLRKAYELELEETKASALAILNASDSALLLISRDHVVISANDRAKILSHQLFQEPVRRGNRTLSILPKRWHTDYLERFHKALKGQENKTVQKLRFRSGGKPMWFQFKYTPVWLSDGTVNAVSWTATDITDQRRSEEYTIDLLERLNLANNAADIGIWEYDFEKDQTKFDDKCIWHYENRLGVQVGHKEWLSCYSLKSQKALGKVLNPRVARDKKDFDLTLQLNDQVHESEFHHVKGRIQFSGDTPVKAVGIVMDISETKRVELKLEQSHYKLNAAQKMAKLGSFEFNIRTKKLEWTDNTFHIHGITNNKVPSIKQYISKIRREDRPRFIELMRDTGRKNESQHLTYRFTVNGIEHTFNAIFKGHFYRNKLHKIIGTIQDVTDNISLIEILDQQKAQLDESSKRMSSYSFANSHKLRAPLSNILGLIQILRLDPSDEIFDMLQRSADDLDKVIHEINDLLAD